MAGTWAPYAGTDALALAAVLFLVGLASLLIGLRLKTPVGTRRPGKAGVFLMVLVWVLSILAFLFDSIVYGFVLEKSNLVQVYQSYTAPNPVGPVTILSALVTFAVILYLARRGGWKVALLSAFVGAAAAPLIFELPFDLVVMYRIYPPIPPSPALFRLLFFLPLFLIEVSTFSLVTLSPLARVSRYTMFSLAVMLFLFAGWALVGFPYPSAPVPLAFNDVGKVVSFVTAITLFWPGRGGTTAEPPSQPVA